MKTDTCYYSVDGGRSWETVPKDQAHRRLAKTYKERDVACGISWRGLRVNNPSPCAGASQAQEKVE